MSGLELAEDRSGPHASGANLSLRGIGLSDESLRGEQGSAGEYVIDLARLNTLAIDELEKKVKRQDERLAAVIQRNGILENRMSYEHDQRISRARMIGKFCFGAVCLWLLGLVSAQFVDPDQLLDGGSFDWLLGTTKTLGTVAFVTFVTYVAV